MEVIGDRGAAALQAHGDGFVAAFHRMKVLNASGARLLAAHDNVRFPLDERSEIDPTQLPSEALNGINLSKSLFLAGHIEQKSQSCFISPQFCTFFH
jgi:hypothetical protein